MPKLSVIIPVYNVEGYLSECLDSVINQTYKDLQIICVNDGSTDNSLKILNDYANKDKRIVVISQENQGVSSARNKGIDKADGDYIVFLDPDDFWELDLAEKTLKKIIDENSDIVLFGHNDLINDKLVPFEITNKIQDVINGTDYHKYFCDFVNFVWDKIYKTDLIKNNSIKFPLNIHQSEDVLFVLECFSYKPQISFLEECLYNYRTIRNGSAMRKYDVLVTNQIKAFKIMLSQNFFINADFEFKKLCIDKLFGGVLYFYILTSKRNFQLNNFIELRKLISCMKSSLPDELLNMCTEYKNFADLTSRGVNCLK